jgi:hypothetical protein
VFVVIKVRKVETGEMREVYTKIVKEKCHMFLGGFSDHVGKFREKFLNQLSICQQDMCHGARE